PTWACTGCGHSKNAIKHTDAQCRADAAREAAAGDPDQSVGNASAIKAERVHALVNDGPWPAMSEAFDAHMGAACWT
ncbi:hypothetical protein U2054_15735, partial [Listeria monocytogenes]|uniref:hypothetical protein n=1 Tax=Listeria monocytogenes TaxID=1639 RepID=UPI002FDC5720